MGLWGTRKLGPLRLDYDIGNIPRPLFRFHWELESMSLSAGFGDGNSDDIVSFEVSVPKSVVRVVNRAAGY